METESLNGDVCEILKKIKSSDGKNNLYEHLKLLYRTKIIINNETQYNDLFEDMSIRLKANGAYFKENNDKEYFLNFLESYVYDTKKKKELLKPPIKIEPDSEPLPITSVNFIPDYLELFQKFEWAGLTLGEKQALLLNNSLRNLSIQLQNGNVTFFGKINGTIKDYYIAETTEVDPPNEFNYDNDMEKRKEDGINRNVFYVTNDLCEKWIELPDIKPIQIIQSRNIRYSFTGDLNRVICSNPSFNGLEKHLLRCQIARIYHGAKLVPNLNHYTIEDLENPFRPLTPSEKPKPLKYEDLISLKNWIHYAPGILNCGRVSHIIEVPENIDPDEYKKKVLVNDPFDKRMKPAFDDKKIRITQQKEIVPWSLSQIYDDSIYVNPYIKLLDETAPDFDPLEQKDNKEYYIILCVKSLHWPGAFNFYIGKESYFFYFGQGLKFLDPLFEASYVFKTFPKIPLEVPDKKDQLEPREPVKPPEENQNQEKPKEEPQRNEDE